MRGTGDTASVTPRRRDVLATGVVCVLALALAPARATAQGCDEARLAALPLVERPTSDTGAVVTILLTGDGGWADADEKVAARLVARGSAVVGLNMRTYLRGRRTPDDVGRDVACIAQLYMARWRRSHFMLLGYSRGADIAPFVVTRLPDTLRQRLTRLALVSPSAWAGFQFHLIDLVRDVRRDDDLPVLPEIAKLHGVAITCIYGTADDESACPALQRAAPAGGDPDLLRVVARDGGHRITGGFDVMADALAEGLRPRTTAAR